MDNCKTIRQIADEIGVTKQAVHQRMRREPLSTRLQGLTQTIDGTVYISTDGENIIKTAFLKEQSTEEPSILTATVDELTPTFTPRVDDMAKNYIDSLKAQISALTADKEHSREQVADLQEELKKQSERISDLAEKLVELTRNSQVLLKQEQEKNTLLLTEPAPDETAEQNQKKPKRATWQFWRK